MPRDSFLDDHAEAVLTIDLDAIVANYRLIAARLAPGCKPGAVVKADAYGLGFRQVAPVLAANGCEKFFVADLWEGISLRECLSDIDSDGEIFVFNGPPANRAGKITPESLAAFSDLHLIPVLNTPQQVKAWKDHQGAGKNRPAAVHIDTGMTRLGLESEKVISMAKEGLFQGLDIDYLFSHLACADDPDNSMNKEQLEAFSSARSFLGNPPASLANSSGVFLGEKYHFDLVRVGGALYGMNPLPGKENPMAPVVSLSARILQIHDIDSPRAVGYGATSKIVRPGKIATIAVGYADGYMRSLSNRGQAFIEGFQVPVIGRVSMDYITLDVSDLAPGTLRPDTVVELIGPNYDIDALAKKAGTLAYEVLTGLGNRYRRVYTGGDSAP
ncbi:MAG: alanine racemase [Rhodospirillaceae bacterium]|jgi:alanine racemase|nr:alanine racemase [Rhodospirillaceae bacterium]MBT5373558.1 alanine racemase [Rhodospirillaceae bacterium]MBT5751664.1 alanine racemase [Rhodospirillaceae bacterium]